jgi:hypothetical protein
MDHLIRPQDTLGRLLRVREISDGPAMLTVAGYSLPMPFA